LIISYVDYMKSEKLTASGSYVESSALVASRSPHSEVKVPLSALEASKVLSWSRAYSESQDGWGSDTIKLSQPVELLVTKPLTASQLASTRKIGSSKQLETTGGLSLSDDATLSEPIAESNSVPISQTLDDTRTVVTQGFPCSDSAAISGFLARSDSLVVSKHYTFSGHLMFSAWYSASGQGSVSDAFTVSQLGTASSQLKPSAKRHSAQPHSTKGLRPSDWPRESWSLKISVVWKGTGSHTISEGFSLSQLVPPLSDRLTKSNALAFSGGATVSEWLTWSGDFGDSCKGTYSEILVLSVMVNATEGGWQSEGWQSEDLVLTKRLQGTIVQRLSDVFTGSLTLTLSVASDEQWSTTATIVLAVLGSLILLAIIAVLLCFLIKRGNKTTSPDSSSKEKDSSEGIEADAEKATALDASLPHSRGPPTGGGRESQLRLPKAGAQRPQDDESGSSYYSDGAPAQAPAGAAAPAPAPAPAPDDGYASSYYSDSAQADAIEAKSADSGGAGGAADIPPPPLKPPAPEASKSDNSSSDSGPTKRPPPPRVRPAPPSAAPASSQAPTAEGSEYSYSDVSSLTPSGT
jgi:hypothetical protein